MNETGSLPWKRGLVVTDVTKKKPMELGGWFMRYLGQTVWAFSEVQGDVVKIHAMPKIQSLMKMESVELA